MSDVGTRAPPNNKEKDNYVSPLEQACLLCPAHQLITIVYKRSSCLALPGIYWMCLNPGPRSQHARIGDTAAHSSSLKT